MTQTDQTHAFTQNTLKGLHACYMFPAIHKDFAQTVSTKPLENTQAEQFKYSLLIVGSAAAPPAFFLFPRPSHIPVFHAFLQVLA